jgi:hypothetical protein
VLESLEAEYPHHVGWPLSRLRLQLSHNSHYSPFTGNSAASYFTRLPAIIRQVRSGRSKALNIGVLDRKRGDMIPSKH